MKARIPICKRIEVRPEYGWMEVLVSLPEEFSEQAKEDLQVKGEAKEYFRSKLLTLPSGIKASRTLQEAVKEVVYNVSDIQGYGLDVFDFESDAVVVVVNKYRPIFLKHYYSMIYPVMHSELKRITSTGEAVVEYLAPYDIWGVNEIVLL